MANQSQEKPVELSVRSDAMEAFIAWEKLRLLYNLVLVVIVVVYAAISGKGQSLFFWSMVGPQAIHANVCFCVGPVAEGYLCVFGFDRRSMRWWLFPAGLILSVAGAFDFMQKIDPWAWEALVRD